MLKITIDEKKKPRKTLEVDNGFIFSNVGKHLLIEVLGELTFEESNDLVLSSLLHLYNYAVRALGEEQRRSIYERSVQMFSLMVDKFYPEGKENRFGILTDEDIKEAEERKLDALDKPLKN